MCTGTTYKLGTLCKTSCGTGYLANTTTKNCDKCNAICKSCTGTTSLNCTACNISTIYSYLYSSTCLTSAACPSGTYADLSLYACTICPSICKSCFYSSVKLSVACSSCPFGYYFNITNFSCSQTCNGSTYPNNVNSKCMDCHFSCLTCVSS